MHGLTFVGAGSLGTAFAVLLARSGPVTLYAREATAAALARRASISVRTPDGTTEAPLGDGAGQVRLVSKAHEVAADDAVVFLTKGRELEDVVGAFQAGWAPRDGFVLGMQNGMAKDEILAGAFGTDRVVGSATVLAARRGDGGVAVTGLGITYLGEFNGARSTRLESLRRRFEAAKLPVNADLDIGALLWTKCVHAVGMFGVGCLSRLPSNVMMQSPLLVDLYLDIISEGAAVAAAEGRPVGDFPGLPIASYLSGSRDEVVSRITTAVRDAAARPGVIPSFSSMAQDVIAGRATEVETVLGDVVRRAARHGIGVPTLSAAYKTIAGIDALLPSQNAIGQEEA